MIGVGVAEEVGLVLILPASTALISVRRLDANWFVKHGLPTVAIGSGQYEIHTVKECVDLPKFANGCRLAPCACGSPI
jgi:acetylornithine deacetylase/succinyl-diaminopimelate desuccinylase-like protein